MKSRAQAKSPARSTPDGLEGWHAFLADLAAQRHERLSELEANGNQRRALACAAAAGQEDAIIAAAALAARSDSAQHELALLQIAEERAQAEIATLKAQEEARNRAAMIEDQQRRLAARVKLAGSIEVHLRELSAGIHELDRLSEEISAAHYALGGARQIVASLDRSAVGSRLSEFCFGLGMDRWLPVACAATKTPPSSFREIELDAQAAYQISQ